MKNTSKNRKKISHSRYAYRNPYLIKKMQVHQITTVEKNADEEPVQVQKPVREGFIARQKTYHRNEIAQRQERIEQAVVIQKETLDDVRSKKLENRELKQQLKESKQSVRQAKKQYKAARKSTKHAKKKNYGAWSCFFASLICFLGIFLAFTVRWLFTTWPRLQMDELVYQLSVSFTGTGGGMVEKFLETALLPSVLCLFPIGMIIFLLANSGKRVRKIGKTIMTVFGAVCIGISSSVFLNRMDVLAYVQNQMNGSDYIEKNYADPSTVNLTFPEEKRNLIMIFLESMEITYADKEDGGAFDTGVIPELVQLSLENENFSGTEDTLNGGVSMPGTTWTMGGLFAATSGLPLQIDISANNMDTQTSFFPSITTLGDILHEQGYKQIFECGSDGVFGGRQLYFTTHGDYEIHDINYYKQQGKLDEDYYVWWGYEDSKLISYAKEELSELGESGEPFNYTMLTVDTHFEDGYLCDLCEDEYHDKYSDVMACSSKQISELISWIREQDWYENTTIVLTGDHPTMDSDFCNDIDSDYQRRVYTNYINAVPAVNESEGMRSFTTFDTFPTVLSALGVEIEGDRLGLGTDLFSGHTTLLEKSDVLGMSTELSKSSDFMKEKASLEKDTDALISRSGQSPGGTVNLIDYDRNTETAAVSISDIFYLSGDITEMRIACLTDEPVSEAVMEYAGNGTYQGEIYIPESVMDNMTLRIQADTVKEKDGNTEIKTVTLYSHTGNLYLCTASGKDFLSFLEGVDALDNDRYTVFMSVQTEAIGKVSTEEKELMEDMGIVNLLSVRQPAAYAIISSSGTRVVNGKDYIRENGELDNGVPYVISSSANDEQSSSIIIGWNYEDCAVHGKGINAVVYDTWEDTVVCSTSFNTADYGPDCNISVEKSSFLSSSKYTLKVTDITGANTVSRVLARVYDESDPEYMKETYLNLNFDHEYEAEIDISGHKKENIRIVIYAEDTGYMYHRCTSVPLVQQ